MDRAVRTAAVGLDAVVCAVRAGPRRDLPAGCPLIAGVVQATNDVALAVDPIHVRHDGLLEDWGCDPPSPQGARWNCTVTPA
jgi:hypothetical protein